MATTAIWMHHGRIVESGDPEDVAASYMRYCRLSELDEGGPVEGDPGDGEEPTVLGAADTIAAMSRRDARRARNGSGRRRGRRSAARAVSSSD